MADPGPTLELLDRLRPAIQALHSAEAVATADDRGDGRSTRRVPPALIRSRTLDAQDVAHRTLARLLLQLEGLLGWGETDADVDLSRLTGIRCPFCAQRTLRVRLDEQRWPARCVDRHCVDDDGQRHRWSWAWLDALGVELHPDDEPALTVTERLRGDLDAARAEADRLRAAAEACPCGHPEVAEG